MKAYSFRIILLLALFGAGFSVQSQIAVKQPLTKGSDRVKLYTQQLDLQEKSEFKSLHWQDISNNIPLGPVNVLREDPNNPNQLYVGTDIGVYLTRDGGKKWSVLGDLPSAYVHDLVVHPRDHMIVIATHGRGMFTLDADKIETKE